MGNQYSFFESATSEATMQEASQPVDLKEFSGLWFQISRTPNAFQNPLAINAVSNYSLNDDGTITAKHAELLPDDNVNAMESIGIPDATGRQIKNKDGSGITYIYEYMPQIGFSIIGMPETKNIWIMSRDPYPEAHDYHLILQKLKVHGFKFDDLIPTYQEDF